VIETQQNWVLIEFRGDRYGEHFHSGFEITIEKNDDFPAHGTLSSNINEGYDFTQSKICLKFIQDFQILKPKFEITLNNWNFKLAINLSNA